MSTRDWKGFQLSFPAPYEKSLSLWILGGVWSQGWNLKELTEEHHQAWDLRLNLTQHGKTYFSKTWVGLTDWELFLDFMGCGAWPFLVGGVICLVNSVNERDLNLLTSQCVNLRSVLLRGTMGNKPMEVWGNNRSVMPIDVESGTRVILSSNSKFYLLYRKVRGNL